MPFEKVRYFVPPLLVTLSRAPRSLLDAVRPVYPCSAWGHSAEDIVRARGRQAAVDAPSGCARGRKRCRSCAACTFRGVCTRDFAIRQVA